jgi:hypothetical protein
MKVRHRFPILKVPLLTSFSLVLPICKYIINDTLGIWTTTRRLQCPCQRHFAEHILRDNTERTELLLADYKLASDKLNASLMDR